MAFEQQILQKLEVIENGIIDIKNHMIDIDSILTEEDYQDLVNYRDEKKKNKLISHEQIKEDLKL